MEKRRKSDEALRPDTIVRSTRYEYRVVGVLGSGGFGITYKVERLSDGVVLAMKEFFPDTLCERSADSTMSYLKTNSNTIETGLNDFVTEATRLIDRKIVHPNVVSIGEVFKANNTAYYTMEFIDGCNLYQYVRRTGGKPLSVPQMLSVIRPVLQVVDILHSHRLTHLDIKHENILLTWESDGAMRPVLIDFGQSKHYDRKGNATSKLTNAGCSEGFAPPEQYMGLTKFTPQADIYALSATVLYLLTAVVPDKEMSASEITARFDRVDPTRSLIPERIRNAVIAGMRKDKDDRTQSAPELAAALGIDISTQSHEGSVTRLLNLDKQKKSSFNWNKNIRPVLYGLATVAGSVGIIWSVIVFVNKSTKGLSPTEQLSFAISSGDYALLKDFAELDSVRAFLPYARILLDSADYNTALKYASLRLGTPDHAEAEILMKLIKARQDEETNSLTAVGNDSTSSAGQTSSIDPNTTSPVTETQTRNEAETKPKPETLGPAVEKEPSNDELFAKASSIADYKALADKGYAKAYAPLAEKYFYAKKYWDADQWIRRALTAGTGTSQARGVADKLETIGFYDNGENGGKPK